MSGPSPVDDRTEWLEADGLGGFASGTTLGVRTRRYHALLQAATTPPTGRMVLVNGLGATPLEELYVLYRKTHQLLTARGIQIAKNYIGEYATSLEMAGASISLLELNDERLALLDAPATSPFFQEH